jgi:hypothetical protein
LDLSIKSQPLGWLFVMYLVEKPRRKP